MVISRDDMGRYLLAICYIAIGKWFNDILPSGKLIARVTMLCNATIYKPSGHVLLQMAHEMP